MKRSMKSKRVVSTCPWLAEISTKLFYRLEPRHQKIIKLRDRGHTWNEIGRLMGFSGSCAYQLYRTALIALARLLMDAGKKIPWVD